MSRIALDQLDEFQGVLETIQLDEGIKWNPTSENFEPHHYPSKPYFGEEFDYEYSNAQVSTNSQTPATYIDWTTESLPVGRYLLLVQVCWRTSNVTSLLAMTLLRDGVDLFEPPKVSSSASTNADVRLYVNGEGVFEVTTAGPINFKLNYNRAGSNGTVHLFNGYIRLFRID